MDARLQADASAIKGLSNQVQGVKGAVSDVGEAKRNIEALARQMKDRVSIDNAAAASAAAAKAKDREREKMLQYPRLSMPETGKPAAADSHGDSHAH